MFIVIEDTCLCCVWDDVVKVGVTFYVLLSFCGLWFNLLIRWRFGFCEPQHLFCPPIIEVGYLLYVVLEFAFILTAVCIECSVIHCALLCRQVLYSFFKSGSPSSPKACQFTEARLSEERAAWRSYHVPIKIRETGSSPSSTLRHWLFWSLRTVASVCPQSCLYCPLWYMC